MKEKFNEQEERWFKRGEVGIYPINTVLDFYGIKQKEEPYIQTNPNIRKPTLIQRVKRSLSAVNANY
jgi:hypothetical protein